MIPWVEQFGDCGQSGSKVHVPLTFFQNLKGNLQRKGEYEIKYVELSMYELGNFLEESGLA